ncbi:hypothetical protein HYC85_011890 [Camellia sinensis]|uniref:DUF868 domain-containing protein n=2 Tax=Camellia sinensis TaxID=4442 RepID=A0A7J7HBH8_CAMSI|nr:hypothetical protein HYC85_011890 [Camellia sinensis]
MGSINALISRVDPTHVLKETQKFVTMSYRIPSSRSKLMSYSQPLVQPLAQPVTQKLTDDPPPVTPKTAQSTVTCVYQTHIEGYWRNVTVLWCKNLMNHSITISIDSAESDRHHSCKIDLKPWHFWSKKGFKTFEVDGNQVEVYWDLRSAKFSNGPEPKSDFYVAIVSEEEVVLLLGDYKKKAYKRTKSRPALVDAVMFYKMENVFNKKCYPTRAKFDRRWKEHDIVVESSTLGLKDPEMWISVDGIVMVHVQNLQWKFRGNETMLVDKIPVQVFWDVHAWLFCSPGSGHGLFIFKPVQSESDSDKEENNRGSDNDDAISMYYSTRSHSKASEFCLFLYAWKLE